jgi:hypothetical protein
MSDLPCALEKHPVEHIQMTKTPMTQENFHVDKYANFARSKPIHLSKRIQAVCCEVTL